MFGEMIIGPSIRFRPDIELNSEDDLLLSIVVPAYNEERRLPDTLEKIRSHLAAQSFRWEAIVVDDGSGDESAAIVEQMVARDGRFRLIRNPHAGKGYAVRTGILAARGRSDLHGRCGPFHADVRDKQVPSTSAK